MIQEREVKEIVRAVLDSMTDDAGAAGSAGDAGAAGSAGAAGAAGATAGTTPTPGSSPVPMERGVFLTMDQAVSAARAAFEQLSATSLETRRTMIAAMRRVATEHVEAISELAARETGLGRAEDKVVKNLLAINKTPGVEDLEPISFTDDDGLTLTERAPYGVIGAITPSTNPTETIISNSIGMVAGGNSVVFNAHPAAAGCSRLTVSLLNEAIVEAGGPENVVATVKEPTIESAGYMMHHDGIAMLVVTGGPAVVRAAMQTTKKVIAAGPGNPPAVVDETADIPKAARDVVIGGSLDNNIICTDEKVILAVASIADELKSEMKKHRAVELTPEQTRAVTELVIAKPGSEGAEGAPNKKYVGKDAAVIAEAIGMHVPSDTRLLFCEVNADHPLVWTEQLMPVMPLVRFGGVDEAIDFAVRCEHGFRHTASMHSRNIEKLSKMARAMNCSLFVKNGSNFNGLGQGGAGYASFTIASPTGEGFTRARTFTRLRRCTLVGAFRIV
ncbi:MAG: aldehyde dehydrogenase family protein [Spirochaetaceae bacterium]